MSLPIGLGEPITFKLPQGASTDKGRWTQAHISNPEAFQWKTTHKRKISAMESWWANKPLRGRHHAQNRWQTKDKLNDIFEGSLFHSQDFLICLLFNLTVPLHYILRLLVLCFYRISVFLYVRTCMSLDLDMFPMLFIGLCLLFVCFVLSVFI